MKTPTVGSTFAGIGGFDLGFELAGFDVTWQAEIDPYSSKTLARHFPMSYNYGDVKNVTKKKEKAIARLSTTVICGGSPCQDISIANKDRKGLDGEQSRLFYEFARIVRDSRPEWFVFENVSGLLTSNGGKDLAIILGCFTGRMPQIPKHGWSNAGIGWGSSEGYKVAWRILDSQYDGVAQQRRRLFIVGHREDGWRPAEVLFDESAFDWTPPTRRQAWQAKANPKRFAWVDTGESGGSGVEAWRVQFNDANGTRKDRPDGGLYVYNADVAGTLIQAGGAGDVLVSSTVNSKWKKGSSGPSGDEVGNLVIWQGHHKGVEVADQGVTPTLTARAGSGGNNQTMVGARRLMPVECEILQGFPEGWTEYYLKDVQGSIMALCQKTLAQYLNVADHWLIGNLAYVSCTISESKNMGRRICVQDTTAQKTDVRFVKTFLEKAGQEDFANAIINHGSVMVIQENQIKTLNSVQQLKLEGQKDTGRLWKIKSAGDYTKANLSIILTWIRLMMSLKTYISAQTEVSTDTFMILWREPQLNFSKKGILFLKMEDIELASDSKRYKQLGNAVNASTAYWLASRIQLVRKMKHAPK